MSAVDGGDSLVIDKFWDGIESIKEKTICPSLCHFKFSDPTTTLQSIIVKQKQDPDSEDDTPELEASTRSEADGMQVEADEDMMEDDIDPIAFSNTAGFDDDDDDLDAEPVDIYPDLSQQIHGPDYDETIASTVDGAKARDLMVSLGTATDNMYSYFDGSALKNWAGPQHWKVNRAFKSTNPLV